MYSILGNIREIAHVYMFYLKMIGRSKKRAHCFIHLRGTVRAANHCYESFMSTVYNNCNIVIS